MDLLKSSFLKAAWLLLFCISNLLLANGQTISRISATAGSTAGGGTLDVIGSGLTTSTAVTVGGNAATVISALADGSRLSATLPAGSAGAANVTAGSATLSGGYTYLVPASILFADDFNSGGLSNWTASPLGLFANWSATGHVADYNGGGHTQIYAGSGSWTDYTVETKFQLFSTSDYPGGLRGRVNLSTGQAYAAWLYPAESTIKLFRTGAWNIDSSGLVLLQQVTVSSMSANTFHRLALNFSGSTIEVIYDGTTVITTTDTALASGAVALDVSNQHIQFDDVLVTQTIADTTPPTVSITAPASNATVSGTVNVTASASDNVGVVSVQFLLDGAALGSPVTTSPYQISWNTTSSSNGSHTLSAQAKDAAGNVGTAANVSVTVSNSAGAPPTIARVSATSGTTAGGGQLDVIGTNLTGATVTIGGQAATFLNGLSDGSRISVTIPAGVAGAADVVASNNLGQATLSHGYTYLVPSSVLFADDFNSGTLSNWTASPLGLFADWSATGHVADNNGGGHTQIYAGSSSWTDYTVETKFQLFSGNNYPGGLRGRVNLTTGQAYAAWLYPGSSQIKLFCTAGWNIDTSGLVLLQQATVSSMAANQFHRLDLSFSGAQITVSYDGAVVITATDSTLTSGAIALDVSNQHIQFEDVLVTQSAGDTTPPTVSITSPASGATLAGTINVTASASDNVGVAGVQFLLDGAALGSEVTVAPYSVSWNTTTASNGSHTLSARARDAAGNTATATNVSVTVAQPTIVGISVAPTSFGLGFVGGQQSLTVTATYSDGSKKDATSSSTYGSSNNAAATVSSGGVVTAANNGTAVITASFSGFLATSTATVRLSPPALERLSPPYGSANGGTRMDVIGNNLSASATVTIGGAPANFISALPDGSQMTVTTPAGTVGYADVVVSNSTGTASAPKGYQYIDPTTILFSDGFNLGNLANWTASPRGLFNNWNASGDVADYNGGGHTQIYAGSSSWTNYSVRARFQIFNVSNYPGGLRGRVNLSNGFAYEAWLLPASSQIRLYRIGDWNIDTNPVLIGQANVPYISPDLFHTLQMIFNGAQITVLLDGPAVLQVTDTNLTSGAIALDVSDQHIQYDDLLVTTIPADTVPPTVSITAPAGGTVSGSTTISASASDNIGVAGVQFLLDGVFLGPEQNVAPYSIRWNTASAVNGAHTLTAMARDASGNVTTSAAVAVTVNNTFDPTQAGQWTAPFNWPIVAIHLSVLKTGEVISWDGPPANGGTSVTLWNPGSGTFTSVPNSATNMFCDGQTILNDGRMLTAGGHADWGVGIPNADIYDPVTRLWSSIAPMNFPRWYPTLTTLPDGRVLSISGSDQNEDAIVPTPEIYNPSTNTWTAYPNSPLTVPLYPFMFVLPDGRVLEAGSVSGAAVTEVLDLNQMQWSVVDSNVVDGHSAVMYRPGKIMKSGTGSVPGMGNVPAQPVTFVLDMTQPTPQWTETASMNFPRAYHTLTMLPDGNVLATGGETALDGANYANAVLQAEQWSPSSQSWTIMAPEQIGRLYHSTAVLLLDGRVLVAGSGRAGTAPQLSAEIYSPPYLFRGPRPTISSAPSEVGYGSSFAVNTPDPASISSVSLIRLSAATHGFNNGQTFQSLAFQQISGGLSITAPANSNLAPPGYYALFIVNSSGVPSVAAVVQLP